MDNLPVDLHEGMEGNQVELVGKANACTCNIFHFYTNSSDETGTVLISKTLSSIC